MTDQRARLTWQKTDAGEVPVSTAFDDPYFSLVGGQAETAHVFLAGNDLPGRFHDGFCIAELGFGTGLNFLTALKAWRGAGVPGLLHFTSFEAFPLDPADLSRALAAHGDLPTETLADNPTRLVGADFTLTVLIGDARDTLPEWAGKADAWFLDGFSPAKNPELWEASLMQAVADHHDHQHVVFRRQMPGNAVLRRENEGGGDHQKGAEACWIHCAICA